VPPHRGARTPATFSPVSGRTSRVAISVAPTPGKSLLTGSSLRVGGGGGGFSPATDAAAPAAAAFKMRLPTYSPVGTVRGGGTGSQDSAGAANPQYASPSSRSVRSGKSGVVGEALRAREKDAMLKGLASMGGSGGGRSKRGGGYAAAPPTSQLIGDSPSGLSASHANNRSVSLDPSANAATSARTSNPLYQRSSPIPPFTFTTTTTNAPPGQQQLRPLVPLNNSAQQFPTAPLPVGRFSPPATQQPFNAGATFGRTGTLGSGLSSLAGGSSSQAHQLAALQAAQSRINAGSGGLSRTAMPQPLGLGGGFFPQSTSATSGGRGLGPAPGSYANNLLQSRLAQSAAFGSGGGGGGGTLGSAGVSTLRGPSSPSLPMSLINRGQQKGGRR